MQLSVRSVIALGVSVTAAATIALAPLPTAPVPATRTAPVVLTGAWQELEANVKDDLANLTALIAASASTPILNQLASNFTTYGKWLAGEDGGSPAKVVKTIGEHIVAVGTTLSSFVILGPLSFVGPFIAPGVMIIQLVADTAKYPSTPQTVLQAFIDAPANYLNVTLNCCSTPLFSLAFGLLNPGPLGYLLQVRSAIAAALQIVAPLPPEPAARALPAAGEPVGPAVEQPSPASAVGQSRRVPSAAVVPKAARSAKRPDAAPKSAAASARKAAPGGTGQSARPGNPGTR